MIIPLSIVDTKVCSMGITRRCKKSRDISNVEVLLGWAVGSSVPMVDETVVDIVQQRSYNRVFFCKILTSIDGTLFLQLLLILSLDSYKTFYALAFILLIKWPIGQVVK